MTIGDTQNSHVKKTCHGPSHGPGGIHRSRRVPWDTFQRGNVDCYEIDYSLVPFTMRTTKLHVIQKNRQNARRSCTELFLLSWRRNLFVFLGGWFSRKQRAWSFQVVKLTYIVHLEGFFLNFVQRHLLCMQQFHSISHNSGRNVYPCEFEIPVCIINTCVLSERIKHEIALCKGIKPWIPDSRCWIPLFVSRAWILDPNRLWLLDSLTFPIPVTKIIPDSGFQNQKFPGSCYPPSKYSICPSIGKVWIFSGVIHSRIQILLHGAQIKQ